MTTTNSVPSSDVEDFMYNVQQLDNIATGSALTYTDRLGQSRSTAAGVMARFAALNPRGAWTTATTYQPRDLVLNSGTWYIALDAHTSGATFAGDLSAHWRPEQGVTSSDLSSVASAADGAGRVGYLYSLAYAAGNVGYKLKQLRTPQDLGTAIPGTSFAIGPEAGSVTTGIGNLAVGYRTLTANTTGQYSTALGANNQYFANGLGFNTSVGYGTAYNITTGYSNVAMGFEALHDCQAGTSNCVVGYSAQHYGLANGGVRDTHNVTAFGTFACQYNQADSTVGVGLGALKVNTGNGNVACGNNAGVSNTSGSQSVFVGESAGGSKVSGAYDVFVGFQAGYTQTTSGGFNTVVGGLAGYYNTTATQNVFVGYSAGQGTSGQNGGGANVAVGNQAMGLCGSVSGCVAVGNVALRSVTGAGSSNVGVGSNAGLNVTTGASNTFVGTSAGVGVSTANQSTGIGQATLTNLNGLNNTALGYNAGSPASAQTWTNTCSLGANSLPTGSNQVTLGDTSITTIRAQVTTITAISDARDKKDIQPLADLLPDDFLDEVEAVAYRWAMRDGTDRGDALHAGVIAQQLKAVQDRHGLQWLKLVDESDPNRLEATPGNLLMPLVVSAQRMRAQLAALADRVASLEGKVE